MLAADRSPVAAAFADAVESGRLDLPLPGGGRLFAVSTADLWLVPGTCDSSGTISAGKPAWPDSSRPAAPARRAGGITDWTWKPAPEPALTALAPGRAWELARYRAYQRCLADQTIGCTFGRAASFLNRTAANALSIVDKGAQARR
jgi:hypothetical protein